MALPVANDPYILGRGAAETRRLMVQGDFRAPFTRRFLLEAGVGAGMRVLDVGSGAGDAALLAAELVGPQGAVAGIDANPLVLETARRRAWRTSPWSKAISMGAAWTRSRRMAPSTQSSAGWS